MKNIPSYTFDAQFAEFLKLYRGIDNVWIGHADDTDHGSLNEPGVLYAQYIDGNTQKVGPVSGYYYALQQGFQGTFSEWVQVLLDATQNAMDAEAFAKGTVNGADVSEGETGYHDNSKWYSEQSNDHANRSEAAQLASEQAQRGAETAQEKAELAQSKTETAQTKAEAAQRASQAAQQAAESAQLNAETAQNKSEYAQAASELAQSKAETARTASESAQSKAETAQAKAEAAQQAAESAQSASELAEEHSKVSSETSEAWATGTVNGTPVSSTHVNHHNNAKYYSGQASASASSASTSSSSANNAATLAQKWATGGTGQEYTTGKSAKEQADRASMLTAGNSNENGSVTENALSYKNLAKAWAVKSENTGSPSNTNNSEYYAEQSNKSSQSAAQWAAGNTSATYQSGMSAKEQADRAAMLATGNDSASGSPTENALAYKNLAKAWATSQSEVEAGFSSARSYAERAAESSKNAEQWATGETGGTPSSSNNAKEYARQSEAAKNESERWATGGTGGSASASNNSKYFSQQAAQWATGGASGTPSSVNNAMYYSEQSSLQADESEAWAVGTKNGIAVQSGEVQHQNNAKYYAQEIVGPKYDDAIAKLNKFENLSVDVASLDPGSAPTAVLDKDGTGYILHLGIPKGENGNIYALIPKVDPSTGLVTFEWTTDYTVINSETMLYESTGTTTIHDKVEALEQINEPISASDINALFH